MGPPSMLGCWLTRNCTGQVQAIMVGMSSWMWGSFSYPGSTFLQQSSSTPGSSILPDSNSLAGTMQFLPWADVKIARLNPSLVLCRDIHLLTELSIRLGHLQERNPSENVFALVCISWQCFGISEIKPLSFRLFYHYWSWARNIFSRNSLTLCIFLLYLCSWVRYYCGWQESYSYLLVQINSFHYNRSHWEISGQCFLQSWECSCSSSAWHC